MQYLKIDSTCLSFVVHEITDFNVLATISILAIISNSGVLNYIPLKTLHVLNIRANATHTTTIFLRDICISSFLSIIEIIDHQFH